MVVDLFDDFKLTKKIVFHGLYGGGGGGGGGPDIKSRFDRRFRANINPLTAKLFILNFHPLEVVFR